MPAIDFMRGAVMVLMALDHVRTFFSDVAFAPEDVQHTWMALFLTRWVTHFCAPLFFLLAGTSAYLSGVRRGPGALSSHLWRRGAWLIVLELTLVGFAWSFKPGSSFAGVIWCLGWSMMILAALIRLPRPMLAAIAIAVIAGHDLLDGVSPKTFGAFGWLWRFLHVPGRAVLPGGIRDFVLFPIVPWFAVMALGYALGPWFSVPLVRRTKTFLIAGAAATALFAILRLTNAYGNPPTSFIPGGPGFFRVFPTAEMTTIAFLDTEKYPPSLQFLLMTLGPSLVAFAAVDRLFARRQNLLAAAKPVIVFGRVPFFYYVCHLYLIHIAALIATKVTGRDGWSLGVVWLTWIAVVIVLYVPCRWFDDVKRRSSAWWVGYV